MAPWGEERINWVDVCCSGRESQVSLQLCVFFSKEQLSLHFGYVWPVNDIYKTDPDWLCGGWLREKEGRGKIHIRNSGGKLSIFCSFDFIFHEEQIFPKLYLNEVAIFNLILLICFELLETESETSQNGRSQWPRFPSTSWNPPKNP